MTRKDYILIAGALRIEYGCVADMERESRTILNVAERIAWLLYADNPRFDRKHLLAVVRGEKELNNRPARTQQAT